MTQLKYQVVTDAELEELFHNKNFGFEITACVKAKRKQLLKNVTDKFNGYWNGHNAFHMMLDAGLVLDGRPSRHTKLTQRGINFMNQENDKAGVQ
tara:strand:- start:441 stop:725 length:285 start_codon:yes stop_codon:yes gene_type:complete